MVAYQISQSVGQSGKYTLEYNGTFGKGGVAFVPFLRACGKIRSERSPMRRDARTLVELLHSHAKEARGVLQIDALLHQPVAHVCRRMCGVPPLANCTSVGESLEISIRDGINHLRFPFSVNGPGVTFR